MKEKLLAMIADASGIDAGEIKPESNLYTDLGMDSVTLVALVMDCQDEFGMEADDETLAKIQTVGDIIDILTK